MRILDIIAAKRDGQELSAMDISHIVSDFVSGNIPDYQMSAFLMACYIRGLSFAETAALTKAMISSGEVLDLSSITGTKMDKHSTGGVGDKTTLVMVPMLASCGLKVPKMSGRGLGFTGGTLDKLESIPGFSTALTPERFVAQTNNIGAAIVGQSKDIVPADKKIYALRDVTATVESLPLIAASIMSKKIACSSDVILLDVKVGSGAFMRDVSKARDLADTMIAIGTSSGRKVCAAITDMSQPLGYAVGNALEVVEAVETLKGRGPADLRLLCIELSAVILYKAGQTASFEDGRSAASSALDSGRALDKFREIVAFQGGNSDICDDESLLPQARNHHEVLSRRSGIVSKIACADIGVAASMLGAGRQSKEDVIDPAVGVVVKKKLGDRVEAGEPLAVLYANDATNIAEADSKITDAYEIGKEGKAPSLIHEVIC